MEGAFEGTAPSSTAPGHSDSMTIEAYRVARAATRLKAAFAVAVGMNLVEGVWDPSGLVWTAARLAAAALFIAALVAYVALGLLRWRRTRRERP